jgi:hypothetical protein
MVNYARDIDILIGALTVDNWDKLRKCSALHRQTPQRWKEFKYVRLSWPDHIPHKIFMPPTLFLGIY